MNRIIEEDILSIVSSKIDWKSFSNKRVLVSGASGFLAAYIVETLLRLNEVYGINVKVTALVRNKEKFLKRFSHQLNNSSLTMLLQDVSKPFELSIPHQFIIHAASQASPKYYGIDPVGTIKANVLGTMNLLDLAKTHSVESFLFFSSGEVYGETRNFPTKESDYGFIDPVSVRACYAESKRMGESLCVAWHAQYKVPAKIVRPFHTYGPGFSLDDGRVYADFVKNVVDGESITMKSDGTAKRAFCYISDATKGFFTVLLEGENGVPYNVGNSKAEVSVKELAELLCNLFPERKLEVINRLNSDGVGYLKSPISRNCPDISRISKLGWVPQIGIMDGFKRTIESYLV